MASFTDQIQYYTGDTDLEYSGKTQQWFEDGIRDVIGRVEKTMPDKLSMFTSNQTVTSSGLELVNNRVFSVERGGKEASEVNAKLRYNLTDIESIYYAYPDSPSYYRLANKLYVLPSPGTGTTSATITSAERELVDGVYITKFWCNAAHGLNNNDFIDIIANSTALPAIYTANTLQVTFISSSEFSVGIPWSNIYDEGLFVGASGYMDEPANVWYPTSSPSIKISSATAEVVTIGTVSNGDESTDGSITSFPASMYHLPVLYTSINILYRKMRDMTITAFTEPTAFVAPASLADSDVSFSEVGTFPSFVKPLFSAPSIGTLPSAPSEPVLTSTTVSFSQPAPTYVEPVVVPDFSDANTLLNTDEDTELVSSRIQIIGAQIQEYQANIQNAINTFNEENAEYQAQLEISIQNAQLDNQDDGLKLQKYSAEVQAYQAEVNTVIQNYQIDYGQLLAEYGQNIQNEIARVQNEAQDYQQKVSKALQEYQAETGYNMAKQNADLQAAVQVYTNSLQSENAKFQANMAKDTTEYQWLAGQLQYVKQLYNEGFIQAPQS